MEPDIRGNEVREAAPPIDVGTRLKSVRARLPGQALRERIDLARAGYGPLYALEEIRTKVSESLPMRIGYGRHTAVEPIETFAERIPDDVLLKYDDAVQSGLFSTFWVATPMYRKDRHVDPWVVAQVTGTAFYAVIAQWDPREGGR